MKFFITISIFLVIYTKSAIAKPEIWMNLFFLTADLSEVTENDLDKLRLAGATGIELPGSSAKFKDCERLGHYIKKYNLGAALNVAVFENTDPSSVTKEGRLNGAKYLKKKILCAEALGANIISGPFILPLGTWPNLTGHALTNYINLKKKLSIPTIREIADFAAAKGILLGYEPLTRWEMPGLNTVRETIEYLKQVNHANIGLTLDISHEVLDGEGPKKLFKQLQWLKSHNKLFQVHVSAPHRGELRNSWLPWKDFFTLLKPFWNKQLVIEIMNSISPFAQPNGEALRMVRPPFKNPHDVAKKAIRTTIDKWENI